MSYQSDSRDLRKRYRWMIVTVLLAFGVVVARLFDLQIVHGSEYASMAHENIIKRAGLGAIRGVIRDTRGKVLATTRTAYNVELVPGRVMPNARPVRYRNGLPLPAEEGAWSRIVELLRLNPDEQRIFEARIRQACRTDDDKSPCWRHRILVREDVSRDIVAEIRQHPDDLPGVTLTPVFVREYPEGDLGAHAIGYVAEIDAETLARVRATPGPLDPAPVPGSDYERGDRIGATGIERSWESYLRGRRGWEKRVVDAHGHYRTGPDAERLLDPPVRQDPISGRDLKLSLDIDLERGIAKAMRAHPAGAVVVVDVRTGRLLALFSKPEFDLNDVSGGYGKARVRETFNRLLTDPYRPLFDKTMSGTFQPGSTMKPFSALAALRDGLVNADDTERCDGYIVFGHRVMHCKHTHHKVQMRRAISESCNIYFWRLAETVTMDRLARTYQEFGLGAITGLGTSPEAQGRVPTRSWYALRYRGQFVIGNTLNMAIGEGDMMVTPLQLALAYAALANGGTLYHPQIIEEVEASDGTTAQQFPPRARHEIRIDPKQMSFIRDALHDVVNTEKGSAYASRDPSLDVAGKTGTAQTGYVAKGDAKTEWFLAQDHAWFAAFAPAANPEIAVVALVEHGGAGGKAAAPVVIDTIREYTRLQALRAVPKKGKRP